MSGDSERSLSDDELMARLGQAEKPPVQHDPFFDLPVAREVGVPGDGTYKGDGPRCTAPARRPTAVPGGYGTQSTEQVRCELEAGHDGPHRAGFNRTALRHRWRAFEWGP